MARSRRVRNVVQRGKGAENPAAPPECSHSRRCGRRADPKLFEFYSVPSGTVPAFMVHIVKSVRTSLSVISLVVALVGSTSLSAFVAAVRPVCAAEHHDCAKTPTIKACCCGDPSGTSDHTGPMVSKVTFSGTLVPVAPIVADIVLPASPDASRAAHASPPRSSRVDLPTLFASLLI